MAAPVLCFGDSITEGYHGIWGHPEFGPKEKPNGQELEHLRLHPYAIRLGALLAHSAGAVPSADLCDYATSLRFAEVRAWSGWTAEQLLPKLEALLRAGPWRCAVVLAGSNDIVLEGRSAEVALERVRALHACCRAAEVPVVAVVNPDCDTAHHGLVPPAEAGERREQLARLAEGVRQTEAAIADARQALPMDAVHAALWDDSIHPSPEGQHALAEAVHAAIIEHRL